MPLVIARKNPRKRKTIPKWDGKSLKTFKKLATRKKTVAKKRAVKKNTFEKAVNRVLRKPSKPKAGEFAVVAVQKNYDAIILKKRCPSKKDAIAHMKDVAETKIYPIGTVALKVVKL